MVETGRSVKRNVARCAGAEQKIKRMSESAGLRVFTQKTLKAMSVS